MVSDRRQIRHTHGLKLALLLQAFLQPEQLGADDSWYCPRCKAHVQAAKKLDLWTLPEVLIVHLKRFSYSVRRRTKLDNPVSFPVRSLDMGRFVMRGQVGASLGQRGGPASCGPRCSAEGTAGWQGSWMSAQRQPPRPRLAVGAASRAQAAVRRPAPTWRPSTASCRSRVQPPRQHAPRHQATLAWVQAATDRARRVQEVDPVYELYAVSNHYGGLGGGHYTAYCQVEGQGWCNFDDTSASPMDAAKLETPSARESAYLLFYRRQAEAGAARPPRRCPPLVPGSSCRLRCRGGHSGLLALSSWHQLGHLLWPW